MKATVFLFNVNNLQNFRTIDKAQVSDHYYSPRKTTTTNIKVAIENIKSIKKFKSLKSKKRKGNLQGFGALLMSTGLITTVTALFVKDQSNRQKILVGGASQFALGITFISLGSSKKYNFRAKENPWVIQK